MSGKKNHWRGVGPEMNVVRKDPEEKIIFFEAHGTF